MKKKVINVSGSMDIIYRIIDDGGHGIPLVFSGGLGGNYLIWSGLIKSLRANHKIVIWDYPGLTGTTQLPTTLNINIRTLAQYQQQILKTEQLKRVCLVGWSVGAQVALEHIGLQPNIIAALISICGVSKRPFDQKEKKNLISSAMGLPSKYPAAIEWISEHLERIEKFKSMLRRIDHPTKWAKRFGFVDPDLDELIFDAVIRDFLNMDATLYGRYVKAAAAHDATGLLIEMKQPLLAISGERDKLVPKERVMDFAKLASNSEYFEVRGATHFAPLEYASLLGLKIENFLETINIK